jgi:peptidoglycan hydrolase-like protein with peptidoglycan-binding domain
MRMPASRPSLSASGSRMRAKSATRPEAVVGDTPDIVHQVIRSPGQPLDTMTRTFFEPRFGHDFGQVRVHTDTRAAGAALAVGAHAFTVNRHIAFGRGQYAPDASAGRQLLAHELAHVVQQSGGTRGLSRSPPVVQRRIGDGHDLASPWLAGDPRLEGAFDNEVDQFLRQGSKGTAVKRVQQLLFFLGFDIGPHGADGDFGPDTDAAVRAFQTIFAPPVDGIIGPITIGALDTRANQPEANRTAPGAVPAGPPTGTPPSISVDRIDIVNGAAGAIGGFPAIVGGASLNTPGPFNSPTEVKNSLQVHFHLDNGSSADLTPLREIQRTATTATGTVSNNPPDQVLPPGVAGPPAPGGFTGVLIGNDGPAAHEIQRPTGDTIVVADAPGLSGMVAASYPVTYRAHFILTMGDPRGAPIARANYDVLIDKRSATEVPNTENRVVTTAKKDFVRSKDL